MSSANGLPGNTTVPLAQSLAAFVGGTVINAYDYAERGLEDVRNAVWKSIRPEEVPRAPGWKTSLWNTVKAVSWMNILLVALPLSWVAHFNIETWGHNATFALCFLAMIPLQKIFDWGGEQIGEYLEEDLKDLLVITLSNAVEATLAIILLLKCELRLLQSTLIGVVLLHLLLIPGTPFFVHGAQQYEQMLHPQHTSVNPSLLMIGVLSMFVPTAFFASLDRGSLSVAGNGSQTSDSGLPPAFTPLVSDSVRDDLLKMSRGISVVLLVIYVASRIYQHLLPRTRPGHDYMQHKNSIASALVVNGPRVSPEPQSATQVQVNPWVCAILLVVAVALMAPTAEFLVSSIEDVREDSGIQTEWFGLILLPILSFSGDGIVAIWNFVRRAYILIRRHVRQNRADGTEVNEEEVPEPLSSEFAHGRPIDLSIQFTLWWTPFLVLLGWWTERPMHLLFDYFEVALLLGACFLVNYVMQDSKTNMSEGLTMICFYVMIATAVWFYPGQPQVGFLLSCPGSVAEAVAQGTPEGMERVVLG